MDGATLQARIYNGYAKAATRLGFPCDVYRPLSASAPLANHIANIPVSLNAQDFTFQKPNLYGKAIWYALMDATVTKPGDYLVRGTDGNQFFIAGQQPHLPIIVVECNRLVWITRQVVNSAVGQLGYSGITPSNAAAVLGTSSARWPASILLGGRSQNAMNLPVSGKDVGWMVLLPPSATPEIMAGDLINDDLGRVYIVDGAEQTDLGWRIKTQELHT